MPIPIPIHGLLLRVCGAVESCCKACLGLKPTCSSGLWALGWGPRLPCEWCPHSCPVTSVCCRMSVPWTRLLF
ncbi:hypothetical protein B0T19DRAFT_431762 [Cercophora scortea]|uniref:Secreted protein n=1 Tax=Cercophora scortea TaxID=314031 RepID=A0AAE0I9S6_9PEZI|nr:hypothetical protein B0T19DRAFT_431762 [Cercophora scortea]